MRFLTALLLIYLTNVFAQNLIIQTSIFILKSYFKKYSHWLESSLNDGLASVVIEQKLQLGHIRAHRFKFTSISVSPAILSAISGYYYLQVPNVNANVVGVWTRNILIERSGNFALRIHNVTITIGRITPVQYDGLPFIDPTVNCTLEFEHFTRSTPRTFFYRSVHTFLDRIVLFEIKKIISRSAVSIFDSFLRHGVEQISLRHLLQTGLVMNNALVGQPEITAEGNFITYHVGLLDSEGENDADFTKSNKVFNSFQQLHHGDVIYAINVKMIAEVVKAAYSRSVFDCRNHQLRLQLLDSPTWDFLDREVKARFIFKLQQHVPSVVSNQLTVPLPVVQGTAARDGVIIEYPSYCHCDHIMSPSPMEQNPRERDDSDGGGDRGSEDGWHIGYEVEMHGIGVEEYTSNDDDTSDVKSDSSDDSGEDRYVGYQTLPTWDNSLETPIDDYVHSRTIEHNDSEADNSCTSFCEASSPENKDSGCEFDKSESIELTIDKIEHIKKAMSSFTLPAPPWAMGIPSDSELKKLLEKLKSKIVTSNP
uniref:PDZ domain-containing protein n=1 Tax=Setaria digitata TaxID=48799 RepID=A0A915PGI0_9BILA